MTIQETEATLKETQRLLALPNEPHFHGKATMPREAQRAHEQALRRMPSIRGGNVCYDAAPIAPRRPSAPTYTPVPKTEKEIAQARMREIEAAIQARGTGWTEKEMLELNKLEATIRDYDKSRLQRERAWAKLSPSEQRASDEWDTDPTVRTTANREIYVLARAAELDGTSKVYQRQGVTVEAI